MEPLFEVLYIYAAEKRCGSFLPEDRAEQFRQENKVRRVVEELTDKGCEDLAQQMEDSLTSLSWLSQRRFFRAGLSIGLELSRL